MDSYTLILVLICSLSLIFSIVSMILGIVILSKLKEIAHTNKMQVINQPMSMQQAGMVQRTAVPQNSRNLSSQGTVICRNCYSSIPDNVKICPCCQASVDRR